MNQEVIIALFLVLITLGLREGVVWKYEKEVDLDKKRNWSALWHKLGAGMRFGIILAIFLEAKASLYLFDRWLYGGIALILASIWYNIAINITNDLKWYYLGTTAKTDQLIKKCWNWIKNLPTTIRGYFKNTK